MKNDFKPVVDHRFNLRADWGAVDCQVLAVEPNKTLSYTWAAMVSRVSSPGLSPRRARGPTCAWSSRASGRISSRPTRAPRTGGSSSLRAWSRSWRGSTEALGNKSKLGSKDRVTGARAPVKLGECLQFEFQVEDPKRPLRCRPHYGRCYLKVVVRGRRVGIDHDRVVIDHIVLPIALRARLIGERDRDSDRRQRQRGDFPTIVHARQGSIVGRLRTATQTGARRDAIRRRCWVEGGSRIRAAARPRSVRGVRKEVGRAV